MSTDTQSIVPANLEEEILKLKKELNAVILAHYYQDDEIQDIADFIGDSLDLSRKAKDANADAILFCGVKFMAEVAKILSPNTLVMIPDMKAGCSLEESCQPEEFAAFKQKHPNAIAITYINCSAEIKALSDIICTSSNAEKIINSIPKEQEIIFAPDRHLGRYLEKKTGRDMILWNGSCVIHERFSYKEIVKISTRYPNAKIVAHPECTDEVLSLAHHIGSTKSLLNYTKENQGGEFVVITEPGIVHQMKQQNPTGVFHLAPWEDKVSAECSHCNNCHFMRLNTIEKIYLTLKHKKNQIEVPEEVRLKAQKSLDRMLEIV